MTRKRVDLSLGTYWADRDFRLFTVVAVMQPSAVVARLVVDAPHRRLLIAHYAASRIFPGGWVWPSSFFSSFQFVLATQWMAILCKVRSLLRIERETGRRL